MKQYKLEMSGELGNETFGPYNTQKEASEAMVRILNNGVAQAKKMKTPNIERWFTIKEVKA